MTEKDILTLAAIRPSPNILASLNPDAITRRTGSNPGSGRSSSGREFPDRLVIVVRERKAVALLQREAGRLDLLDSDAGNLSMKLELG